MLEGVLQCSKYAFGPNRLHYCGPDANREIFSYIEEGAADPHLEVLLKNFRTMYPYITHIAHTNGIADPFDTRVVEAYWIGNELLEKAGGGELYKHLQEDQKLPRKVSRPAFSRISDIIRKGAFPHHSFHVFSITMRTGHLRELHTLESMDACRISWGKVIMADGPFLTVETEPLVTENDKLALGKPVQKRIARALECESDIEQVKPGDIVTIHWEVPCEIITEKQARTLQRYTLKHIDLANRIPL